jgi:hypothetical protein
MFELLSCLTDFVGLTLHTRLNPFEVRPGLWGM